jgi:hypothetical protein
MVRYVTAFTFVRPSVHEPQRIIFFKFFLSFVVTVVNSQPCGLVSDSSIEHTRVTNTVLFLKRTKYKSTKSTIRNPANSRP